MEKADESILTVRGARYRAGGRWYGAPGVTLIEILIVVTIMGIAASIVVPSIVRPGQMTIQGAARQVISDILVAQNEAVAEAAERRLDFNVGSESYRLTDDAGSLVPLPWMKSGYEYTFGMHDRYEGVEIDTVNFGGNSYVGFDELGGTTTGGTVDLIADGYRYRITVRPFTGQVSVAMVN